MSIYVCPKKCGSVYLFFKARYEHMFLNAFHLLFNDKDSKRHNCFRQVDKSIENRVIWLVLFYIKSHNRKQCIYDFNTYISKHKGIFRATYVWYALPLFYLIRHCTYTCVCIFNEKKMQMRNFVCCEWV